MAFIYQTVERLLVTFPCNSNFPLSLTYVSWCATVEAADASLASLKSSVNVDVKKQAFLFPSFPLPNNVHQWVVTRDAARTRRSSSTLKHQVGSTCQGIGFVRAKCLNGITNHGLYYRCS